MPKIKNVLVSQPPPERGDSPYLDLAKKYNFKVAFRKFFKIEGVPAKDLRQDRTNLLDYTGVIFTSKNAVDHYFRICGEMRVTVPDTMKYFCVSESIALYLQKYVVYRKRKIFHSRHNMQELVEIMKKHKNENFLFPCSGLQNPETIQLIEEAKYDCKPVVFYNTIPNDLSDIDITQFDLLVFFSPVGIKSLFENFPDFKQGETLIATFGNTTTTAAKEAGIKPNIIAPTPKAPSMTMAIEQYLECMAKSKK